LGQLREALADADEALRRGPRTERLLLNVACLYARAAGMVERPGEGAPLPGQEPAWCYQERAVKVLTAALRQLPQGQRRDFWRQSVEAEPALGSLRASAGMRQLAEACAR
jgi:hypothetical protein